MHWFNSQIKSSLLALLSSGTLTPSARAGRIEDIRELMLNELKHCGELKFHQVVRRVRYATDAQALWYARGELMAALAATHGEAIAHEKINHISEKFNGLLPKGLHTRVSPLGN